MNLYDLTKSLGRISQENYFYGHLEDFWYSYTLVPGNEREVWDGQDAYVIEYPSVIKPGFMETHPRVLSQIIREDIKERFGKLSFSLANFLDANNFNKSVLIVKLITSKLDEIQNQILSLTHPEPYKEIIKTQFDQSYESFKKDYSNFLGLKKNKPEPGIEYLEIDNAKWGWDAFGKFCKAFIKSGLIPSDITKYHLEELFRKRLLKEKIVWNGDHPEAHYFFTTLKNNKFIKINPVWQSVTENFIILDQDKQPIKSENLRSLKTFDKKKPSDLKRMREINSLIDLLNK